MKLDTQATLFDMQPLGQEPPVAERKITPGCLLPVAPNLIIDIPRVALILGVVPTIVLKLLKAGKISGYQLSKNHSWRISYASVVEFCDRLRVEYAIADRRPKIRPGARWNNADLLPFPLSDTIDVAQAMIGLDEIRWQVIRLIEDGSFEAYRLYEGAHWRISKTSLFAFADRKRQQFEGQAKTK